MIYEPLRLIAEDQGEGKALAAVMVGVTDGGMDGLCFVRCVPPKHAERMAILLRQQAHALIDHKISLHKHDDILSLVEALENDADEADENNWQNWAATMRLAAQQIRALMQKGEAK